MASAPTESAPVHRPLRLSWPLLAVLLAVLCTAAPAGADYRDVYDECESGVLSKRYSAKDLKLAAQKMSAYQRDYTNCSDAIVQAQTSGKRGTGSGSGTGKSGNGGTGASSGTGATSGGATGGGAGTTAGGSAGGGSAPGSASPLSPDEKYVASQAAIQQADAAGSPQQLLAAAEIPESALTYSSVGAAVPLPLTVALVASAVLALLAAAMSLLARRRRSRVD